MVSNTDRTGKVEYTGNGGVRLLVKRVIEKSVINFKSISRILSFDQVLCGKVVTVNSVYGPQSDTSEEDKDSFYDDLNAQMQSKDENFIVLGNVNRIIEAR